MMNPNTNPRDEYHQGMLDLIAKNLKAQGFTREELRQYNIDRDQGIPEDEAMNQLLRSRAA